MYIDYQRFYSILIYPILNRTSLCIIKFEHVSHLKFNYEVTVKVKSRVLTECYCKFVFIQCIIKDGEERMSNLDYLLI